MHCNFCKKPGHVYEVCFKRKNSVHQIQTTIEPSSSTSTNHGDEQTVLPIYNLHGCDDPPITKQVQINGKPITFELDTGCAATIINDKR